MGINVNSGVVGNIDWSKLVNKLNDVAPEAGVSAVEFDDSTNNVIFTVGEGASARSIEINIPDIDSPGVIDQAEFESLIRKLMDENTLGFTEEQAEILIKEFSNICVSSLPPDMVSMMFDLYALMALFLEASQKQRDAAREIRQAENMAIRAAIQTQAHEQREAAKTGMIVAGVMGGLQLAVQAGSVIASHCAGMKQVAEIKNAKIGATQEALTNAKSELTTQTEKLEQMENIRTANENVAARNDEVALKTQAVDDKSKIVEQKQAALDSLKSDAAPEVRTKAQNELDAAKQDLTVAKQDLEVSKGELSHAEQVKAEAMKGWDDSTPVTEDSIKSQKDLVDIKKDQFKSAANEAIEAKERLNSNIEYVKARVKQDRAQSIGAIAGAIGGAAQGIAQNWAQMRQSNATAEGAQQKKDEEDLDQIKDLFSQAREVIKSVIDLVHAILQAETSSMRDAIQA